jgi:hypothetical protein
MRVRVGGNGGDVLLLLAVGMLSLVVYLLPTFVAVARGARNTGSIVVINLLLGWLLIPWVIAHQK